MTRPPRTVIATMALALVATSCAGSRSEAPGPGQAADAEPTLQVVSVQPAFQGFDPQASYSTMEWEVLRCCLARTLMTYPGVADFEGMQPVPDLASAPPSVSPDGMTWTFHLQQGIRYAPPMADVEVTADDLVRALLRAGSPDSWLGPGPVLFPLIEGFDAYLNGDASSIAGVAVPDRYTLRITTTRPDRSVSHLFSLPVTAPIPPMPGHPNARFGVATGHPFADEEPEDAPDGVPEEIGYGPFLVATGPYMIEGAEALDLAADAPTLVDGFTPGWGEDDPGSLTLVRNPSWDPATDEVRPARAGRIEIAIDSGFDYRGVATSDVDVVMGDTPPPDVLERYRSDATLRDRMVVRPAPESVFIAINVAEPPFDDVHVRRAVALVLDRAGFASATGMPSSSHLLPESLIGSLLSGWTAHPGVSASGDLREARAEMDASAYGSGGMCRGPECRGVLVRGSLFPDEVDVSIERRLATIGIEAEMVPHFDTICGDPSRAHRVVRHGVADGLPGGRQPDPAVPRLERVQPDDARLHAAGARRVGVRAARGAERPGRLRAVRRHDRGAGRDVLGPPRPVAGGTAGGARPDRVQPGDQATGVPT